MNRLIALGIICVIMLSGCQRPNFTELTRSDKSVRYFQRFTGYERPVRPCLEVSEEGAREIMSAGYSYEKALYDETGKLISLSEILNGKVRRKVKYFYDSNNLIVKCEVTWPSSPNRGWHAEYYDRSGKQVNIQWFDKDGNPIDEKEINWSVILP